jgi:cephalosporin hydroxylase
MYEARLFPGIPLDHWQMMDCERIALIGLLARLRPKLAIEVGVYHGGSLSRRMLISASASPEQSCRH